MPEPRHVVVAGDWHGDTPWTLGVIELLPELLPAESPRILIQLGDYGFYPEGSGVEQLDDALAKVDAQLWWLDGNHEHFGQINAADWIEDDQGRKSIPWHADRIFWLPRGCRWTWRHRTWVTVGGAVSPNRVHLTPMIDWFPDEEITAGQAEQIAAAGPADVVLSHDCPDGIDLPLEDPADHGWLPGDVARCEEHRRLVRDLGGRLKPRHWLHGHYHHRHDTTADLGWGPIQVAGLGMNGAYWGNYAVLDVETMQLW
jgi:hypothetical protein